MNNALEDLVGKKVTVWSLGTQIEDTEAGVLEAYEHPFVRLRKGDQVLVFPVYNIRVLKPIP